MLRIHDTAAYDPEFSLERKERSTIGVEIRGRAHPIRPGIFAPVLRLVLGTISIFVSVSVFAASAPDECREPASQDDAGGRNLTETGSRGNDPESLVKGALEWGVFVNGGVAHDWFGAVGDPEFVSVGGYAGRVISVARGRGIFRGNLSAHFEVQPLFVMFQPASTYAFSFTILGKHYLRPKGRVRPFLSGGVGMLLSRTDIPLNTSRLNFTPQLGIGVALLHTESRFYTLEYRVHHVSNANLADHNPGINSSLVQIGISFLR